MRLAFICDFVFINLGLSVRMGLVSIRFVFIVLLKLAVWMGLGSIRDVFFFLDKINCLETSGQKRSLLKSPPGI